MRPERMVKDIWIKKRMRYSNCLYYCSFLMLSDSARVGGAEGNGKKTNGKVGEVELRYRLKFKTCVECSRKNAMKLSAIKNSHMSFFENL